MKKADLFRLLRKRYDPPAHALFAFVANATGASRKRQADAIAMALWPSRGLLLHGFEIKVSRSDWLRELKKPRKAEEIARYCDRWWVVAADASIVDRDAGELPPTWGLLVPRRGRLVTAVEAPPIGAAPLDRGFLAAILRRANDETQKARESLRAEVWEDALEEAKRVVSINHETRTLSAANDHLRQVVAKYEEAEKAAGVPIHAWNLKGIGRLVAFLATGDDGLGKLRDYLAGAENSLIRAIEVVREAKGELPECDADATPRQEPSDGQ